MECCSDRLHAESVDALDPIPFVVASKVMMSRPWLREVMDEAGGLNLNQTNVNGQTSEERAISGGVHLIHRTYGVAWFTRFNRRHTRTGWLVEAWCASVWTRERDAGEVDSQHPRR